MIDLAPFFTGDAGGAERAEVAQLVDRTCCDIGFLVVTGHGVAPDAIADICEQSRRFFALPLADKMAVAGPPGDTFVAYSPLGDPRPGDDPAAPSRPNLREVFHTSRYDTPEEAIAHGYPAEVVASLPPNRWPLDPPGFEAAWKRYFNEIEAFADRMLGLFAVALGLEEGWFADKVDRHLGTLAANWYLEQPVEPEPGRLRIPAHVDFSTLTVLYQESDPAPDDLPGSAGVAGSGLQVHRRDGGWFDVPVVPDSFVVNVGDLLARWTNDRWVATPHRVLNPPRERAMTRRLSVPFFHLPNHDALIEPIETCVSAAHPPRFAPVSAGEWTAARRAGRSADHGRLPAA